MLARRLFGHHLGDGSSSVKCPPDSASKIALENTKGIPIAGSVTFQRLMLYISCAFTAATILIILLLIWKHLHRYTVPREQRQIIRCVFVTVVFSVIALLSLVSYTAAPYIAPIANIYEAFAFASFFLLFVEFVVPEGENRAAFFQQLATRDGKRGGSLGWFKSTWIKVFQFPLVCTIMMILEIIAIGTNTYCINSLSPHHFHLWVTIIQKVSTVIIIIAVFGYYKRLRTEMAPRKPLLKLVSFKLVVGVNFIQQLIFSIISGAGALNGNNKVTYNDLNIGLPAFLVVIENFIFAVFFHYSFRSLEYRPSENGGHALGTLRGALNAMNISDLLGAIAQMFGYLLGGRQSYPSSSSRPSGYTADKYQAPPGHPSTGTSVVAAPKQVHQTYPDGPVAAAAPAYQTYPPDAYSANFVDANYVAPHSRAARRMERDLKRQEKRSRRY